MLSQSEISTTVALLAKGHFTSHALPRLRPRPAASGQVPGDLVKQPPSGSEAAALIGTLRMVTRSVSEQSAGPLAGASRHDGSDGDSCSPALAAPACRKYSTNIGNTEMTMIARITAETSFLTLGMLPNHCPDGTAVQTLVLSCGCSAR